MSSFSPGNQEQGSLNQLSGNAGATAANGQNLLNLGTGNTQAGANFFQTLLHGNQANTTAELQPDINRIRGAQQGTLQAASTLMPRGGGRSAELFSLPFQGNQQIQNLFSQSRTQAPQALAQIGAGQTNAGANLFNVSNSAAGDQAKLAEQNRIAQQEFWNKMVGHFTGG